MRPSNVVYWIARVGAAIIMLQTLYFKFTGAAESIYIFQTVGMEPWGRIGVGVLELIASILILINVTAWMGAALAAGLMVGAIGMHLTLLGIVVKDDGGQLFIYALLVLIFSLYILFVNKQRLTEMAARFYKVG
jgi:putative oxidoreductase